MRFTTLLDTAATDAQVLESEQEEQEHGPEANATGSVEAVAVGTTEAAAEGAKG